MASTQRPTVATDGVDCIVTDEEGRNVRLPRYRHRPLPQGRTIRLLKTEPETLTWPLSRLSRMNAFSLVEYQLHHSTVEQLDVSSSPYIATSYSWGRAAPDAPLVIVVQGQATILPLTATAWEAVHRTLPAVGRHGKSLWVDQICIDQDNPQEKSHQVTLMGDIYRQCWHCMIWLGPADISTSLAFQLLQKLGEAFKHDQNIPIDERQVADLSHEEIRSQLVLKLGNDVLPPPNDLGWVEMAKLLRRDWFTRLWTFQEAILCFKGDASICCGMYHIPVITFMRAAMFMGNEHIFAGMDFTAGRSALAQISSFRFQIERKNATPLVWLLQNNAGRRCTDSRDRIYALLGLRSEDGPYFSIQVDYGKACRDLYVDTTKRIIESRRSLRICADAPERLRSAEVPDIPSWVPDWTSMPLTNAFERLNPVSPYFSTSNGRAHEGSIQDKGILVAEGIAVDSVREIVDANVPDRLTVDDRKSALVHDLLPMLLATLQSWAPDVDDADLAHTIVNTITVDGYTRRNNLGDSGLPPEAWEKPLCSSMLLSILSASHTPTAVPLPTDPQRWMQTLAREAVQCVNRRFALLTDRLLALVPKATRVDDAIVVLHGSSLPFVLRNADNGCFEMIGVCYVDGMMHGEAVNWDTGHEFRIR